MTGSAILTSLKIKRHVYDITDRDCFMDNGCCVQLLTQSLESAHWGRRPRPVLSRRAVQQIGAFSRVAVPHKYGDHVTVFKLQNKEIASSSGAANRSNPR